MKGRALVTGASSGIGKELCLLFARDGHDLILTARSEGTLHALADSLRAEFGIGVQVIPMDLARPGSAAQLAALARAHGPVDFLVSNAGFGLAGPFIASDPGREQEMLQL